MATAARSQPKSQVRPDLSTSGIGGERQGGISAATMNADDKRAVWRWIKSNDQALSRALCDPFVRSLIDAFDASPVFDPELVRKALQQ